MGLSPSFSAPNTDCNDQAEKQTVNDRRQTVVDKSTIPEVAPHSYSEADPIRVVSCTV